MVGAGTMHSWRPVCPTGELDLVFPNGVGNVESLANINNRGWYPLQSELWGEVRYGLHALRHAAASLFIEQGMIAKKVQALLGHASIQMTFDLYGHLFADRESDQAAVAAIEQRLLLQ